MARIRTVKPEFQNSQSMGRVSRDARLTFIELWPQCDDAGRIRANSRMLASVLFPYDADAPTLIDGWLTELENEGCIVRYVVGKDEYLQICHWDHQKIDHPQPSKLPGPQEKKRAKTKLSVREQPEKDREASPVVRAVSSTLTGTITSTVSDLTSRALRAEFDDRFWPAYPKKVAAEAAFKAFVKVRKTGTSLEVLLTGVSRYRVSRIGQEARYTMHAATWLNAGCWRDELPGNEAAPADTAPVEVHPSWNGKRDKVIAKLTEPVFNVWFANAILDVGENCTTIEAKTPVAKMMIEKDYLSKLRSLFGPVEITIKDVNGLASPTPPAAAQAPLTASQARDGE